MNKQSVTLRRKNAGRFTFDVAADGWPQWISIRIDGEEKVRGLVAEDLRDLVYAAQRVITSIERSGGE